MVKKRRSNEQSEMRCSILPLFLYPLQSLPFIALLPSSASFSLLPLFYSSSCLSSYLSFPPSLPPASSLRLLSSLSLILQFILLSLFSPYALPLSFLPFLFPSSFHILFSPYIPLTLTPPSLFFLPYSLFLSSVSLSLFHPSLLPPSLSSSSFVFCFS